LGIRNIDFKVNAEDALKTLSAKPVHIVISDYNMPGMDGLQLLEALRLNRTTSRIGFILVSGRLDEAILSTGRKLGMNNFLRKPFSTLQMKTCMEAVVGKL